MDIRNFFGGKPKKRDKSAEKKNNPQASGATKPKSPKTKSPKATKTKASSVKVDKKKKAAGAAASDDDDDDDDDFVTTTKRSQPQESPSSKRQKIETISVDDDDQDEEAAALALLQGTEVIEVEDDEDEEAAALALLAGEAEETNKVTLDLSQFSNSPKKNDNETNRKRPKPDDESSKSPKKTPKKSMEEEKSPKKAKKMGWGADAVKKLSKNVPSADEDKPKEANKPNHRAAYFALKNRAGPQNLGTKEIPVGAANCLNEIRFVCTGVLESIEREQVEDLIKKYGGSIAKQVSGKTDYVVLGRDAGPSKLDKIAKFKTKTLDEDGFLDLIRSKPPGKDEVAAIEKKFEEDAKKEVEAEKAKVARAKTLQDATKKDFANVGGGGEMSSSTTNSKPKSNNGTPGLRDDGFSNLWTVKYAPKEAKKIVGQQGNESNMNKLQRWLKNWHDDKRKLQQTLKKDIPKKASHSGWEFKATLMAGPPGVGKTTTAHLVCSELGYEPVEMNASDCRNKATLQDHVATLLGNSRLTQFYKSSSQGDKKSKRICLIMDEVDGMGAGDRGGMSELTSLIKKTKIPIICMANDKDSPKMRSLKNYVFVNNFRKMPAVKMAGALRTVLYQEGVKIDQPTLLSIIEGANCDMRQILNNLEMWSHTSKELKFDGVKKDIKDTQKNIKENPFQFVQKFFSSSFHKKSLDDRIGLYFNDYSLAPLFVQETYLSTHLQRPFQGGGHPTRDQANTLERISAASDSIAEGDIINNQIYSKQDFKLLPIHAMASCVRPGRLIDSSPNTMLSFPQVLGKTSSTNKWYRILSELRHHMRTATSSDSKDMRMNYLPYLRKRLVAPLLKGSSEEVTELMDNYALTREDWDLINDICQMKATDAADAKDQRSQIDSKVKSAWTREYNKTSHAMPYAMNDGAKKKKISPATDALPGDDDVDALFEDDKDEDDVSKFSKGGKGKGKAKAKAKPRAKAKKSSAKKK